MHHPLKIRLAVAAALVAAPGLAHAQHNLIVAMPTTPPNIVHMPVHIANDLGLFKKYGLDHQGRRAGGRRLHLPRHGGGQRRHRFRVRARSRSSASAKGANTKMILANMPKLEASMVVSKDIKTLADLKGKRIGIQEPGGFADVLTRGVLRAAKIDPKDVQLRQHRHRGRARAGRQSGRHRDPARRAGDHRAAEDAEPARHRADVGDPARQPLQRHGRARQNASRRSAPRSRLTSRATSKRRG